MNSGRPKSTPWIACVLAVIPPLLFCSFWHRLNQSYFAMDAPYYINDAMSTALAMKNRGWSSLAALYWIRGWKPVLAPSLLAPILFLLKSDIRLAVAVFNLSVYAIFLIYTFRFLRRFLPSDSTVLVTWFIGTLPWILSSTYYFMCELPFMAAGMASLFYLYENDGFASRRQSAYLGCSLALAFCTQPFVGMMNLGLAYLFFVYRAYVARKLTKTDIAWAIFMTGFVLVVPWFYVPGGRWSPGVLSGIFFAWTVLLGASQWQRAKGLLSGNFLLIQTIFLSLFILWFAPFYRTLFVWAFLASYGDLAIHVKGLPLVIDLLHPAKGIIFITLAILAVAARASGSDSENESQAKTGTLLIVAGLLLGTVLAAIPTINNDGRYHYLGLTFIYIVMIVTIARASRRVRSKLKPALLFLGFCHGLWLVNSLSEDSWRSPLTKLYCNSNKFEWQYIGLLVPQPKDKFLPLLLRRISSEIDLHQKVRIIAFMENTLGWPRLPGFSLISRELGYSAAFEFPYELLRPLNTQAVDWGKVKADYILVAAPSKGEVLTAERGFDRMANDLIRLWRSRQLDQHGLTLVRDVPLTERGVDLLILKTNKPSETYVAKPTTGRPSNQ